ncbi:MAG: citrate transporter [Actinobacteria bacterium]|nr:citrate transporter [Actinomycetota bacterium]
MAVGGAVLLGAGVAGAIARPGRVPAWVPPALAVVAAGLVGVVDVGQAGRSLDPLLEPLAFLLLAVPLAVMLADLGVFEALASLAAGRRRVVGGMWLLCTVTTAVLNLDAAVVLLTPLAVRTARRCGLDPVVLAMQPVLLACLASSFLPVSNLTNLIAVRQLGFTPAAFLGHLALPSVAGLAVGWCCYRRAYVSEPFIPDADAASPVDVSALRTGCIVLVVLLAGFLVGPLVGVAPWVVVAVVDAGLVVLVRRVPWEAVPCGTALVAASLAVLAGAAVAGVSLHTILHGSGPLDTTKIALIAAGAANVMNNLPALLVGVARLPHGSALAWPLLLGVNVGPTLLVTGSLASLLWLDSVRRDGLRVGARDYARLGLRVGLPALFASTAVLAGATAGWLAAVATLAAVVVFAALLTRRR